MKPLRIALTKGRLEKQAVALFSRMGCDCSHLTDKGRRLIIALPELGLEVLLAKAADVVTYVEHGVCDLGVVGKDTVMECAKPFYEILDMGFGRCRFAVAGKKGGALRDGYRKLRIATKYPRVAREYFEKKGMDVELIKIEGSVELAPLLGLSDAIVDIVETGATLRENGLEVYEYMHDISARLIVNLTSMKMRKHEIERLAAGMRKAGETT